MNWEKEIIKIIRADEYDHEDVGHNDTTLKVCNFIRENFSQDSESRPVEKLVMQLLADRQVNVAELRHLLNKVKRVKIKEDLEQILIKDLGETYDRIEDKNFINKYAGKTANIYEWCGDWWMLEDDNYVITENCFEQLSK